MKTKITSIAAFSLLFMLNSCAVHKSVSDFAGSENENLTSISSSDFVELNNGEIIYFSDLKYVKGVFRAPHLMGDNVHKFVGSEIRAYQIDGKYAISEKQIENGHKGKVAIDALPGFAQRLVTGSLNVYAKKYFNGRSAVDEFYVQSGNNGKIMVYSPQVLKLMLEDKKHESQVYDMTSLVKASDY